MATRAQPVEQAPINWVQPQPRDWGTALRALIRLLRDADDTAQVFRIMRALNGDIAGRNYRKLLTVPEGGRLAYQRVELAQRFSDRAWIDSLPAGTVAAAYREFLDRTGYSAQGLVDLSTAEGIAQSVEHPHAWFGRRERDIHDIWHILTGYQADEPLGEACLVGFSYAQTGGLGWAFIGAGAALKSLRITGKRTFLRAVIEGYRHGKRAAWLSAEDYEALMAEPLEAARRRLNIAEPVIYRQAQRELADAGLAGI
jgi:ubiquinone biosynthesis protein COQ4